jgi:hypothetical protein
LLVALATLGIRAALFPIHGIPIPAAHDEFSYLLGSDTFASGRLSNPAPPFPASIESIHILVTPQYASKFQPGQALFLALGQKVFGHPFWGVTISAALMNAAFCWMLFGWTSRRWALLVSVYPVLFFTANHYWMDSYWGGAVTATGSALVLGAYPRLIGRRRGESAVLFGAGLALLFFTRPYEGGVLALTVIVLLGWKLRRPTIRKRLARWSTVLPVVLILSATLAFQASLNRSVTGSIFTLPYAMHVRMYDVPPLLWPLPEAQPRHLAVAHSIQQQHDQEFAAYRRLHNGMPGSLAFVCARLGKHVALTLYPVVLIPFLLPAVRTDRRLRALLVCMLVCTLSLLLEVWVYDHYAAPLLVVVLAFVARGLWKTTRQLSPRPRMALEAAAALLLIVMPLARHAYFLHEDLTRARDPFDFAPIRARMLQSLTGSGERSVVFVRYAPTHSPFDEWIYNQADLDLAPVIWARDLGPEQNNRVIAYYGKSRHYWLLEADEPVRHLQDYDAGQAR